MKENDEVKRVRYYLCGRPYEWMKFFVSISVRCAFSTRGWRSTSRGGKGKDLFPSSVHVCPHPRFALHIYLLRTLSKALRKMFQLHERRKSAIAGFFFCRPKQISIATDYQTKNSCCDNYRRKLSRDPHIHSTVQSGVF